MSAEPTCPNGCDLRGEPIPDRYFDAALHDVDPAHHAEAFARYGRCFCLPYGERAAEDRFFSRLIGVSDPERDRIVEWLCPDCGERWTRS